jgi:purine-binding chemotaxis protein CheW
MNKNTSKDFIFAQRAQKLAQPPKEEMHGTGLLQLVVFKLAKETYGIDSMWIREVYPFKDICIIPNVPSFVYGLINIRRRIFSVIDLRSLFEMPLEPLSTHAKVIVLQNGVMEFGIIAEEIIGLKNVFSEDLQDNLPTLTGVRQEFLKGITSDQLLVLDAERLLNSSTLVIDQTS